MSFKGKVAIITGSSSGIGAEIARNLARKGCSVVITGRNAGNLEKVKADCIGAGLAADDVMISVGDVTDDAFLKKLVDDTVSKFGHLNHLVNNAAAIVKGGTVEMGNMELFDLTIATNLRSPILLTNLCIPHLTKTKGSIVNVSSIAGIVPFIFISYYAISKAAMNHFTRQLALELAPKGIRVNSVNPGMIDTPIHEQYSEHLFGATGEKLPAKIDEIRKCVADNYPMRRMGLDTDCAKACAFLLSDEASFTTGHLLVVDGGITLSTAMDSAITLDQIQL